MFTIDDKIKGLPAAREQVVGVFASINSPHLAIPGKAAGPAQAYIIGLRGSTGFAVFVYLYLAEVGDCAVYVPNRRNLSPEEYQDEENEALAFVESMGFMMDNLNFRAMAPDDQDALLKTAPVFQRDPRTGSAGARKVEAKASTAVTLGKLLASF